MEARKLQLSGGSTFVISLPRPWVTHTGLKAGDTLFVETEADGTVTVRPHRPEKLALRRKVFEERAEEVREHLLRKLIGAYIAGYGLIELRFPEPKGPFVRRVAREFCRLVVGPEVVEETRNSLVVQDLSDPSELSSEKCLRRMHLIVRSMIEDAVTALKGARLQLAHEVVLRDQDVDRLYWMVAKQYHLAHITPPNGGKRESVSNVHGYRLVAKLLERIGDHAERIAGTVPTVTGDHGLEAKLGREVEAASASALGILDRSFRALVTRDVDEANEAIDARAQHQRLVDALSHRVATYKGERLLALGAVVDSLGRIASYAADIAEQAINLSVLAEPAAARERS